ncbi:Elongator complex protein 5 [Polychytrium aggregatum]|uniref:Elongator complex protein 5 n=1 Tax=Polychytrium aggregatum TaxID=110093 RepID=UPI0022FED7A5|nr:Elongator complex protein 5 [Polychytrium aggregatum]KAI9193308.1 Elongator complex protein 5 [Polychytrium aggregatum]
MASKQILEKLISGQEAAHLVVLQDTTKQSHLPILHAFLSSSISRKHGLVLVCLQDPPARLLPLLGSYANAVCIDLCSQLPSYAASTKPGPQFGSVKIRPALPSELGDVLALELKQLESPKTTVLFDSFNPLLDWMPLSLIAATVKNLAFCTNDSCRVVLPIHTDSLPETKTLLSIESILHQHMSTHIKILHLKTHLKAISDPFDKSIKRSQLEFQSVDANALEFIVDLEWRKRSGKAINELSLVRCGEASSITISSADHLKPAPTPDAVQPNQSTKSDPTANLSFNLTLTDEQRQAKDQVVLPYLEAQHESESTGGTIHYDPDEDDDFDEEDPDADLDI